jgi:hypothetical protein
MDTKKNQELNAKWLARDYKAFKEKQSGGNMRNNLLFKKSPKKNDQIIRNFINRDIDER